MKSHLVYLISHGHTARGALQTGLLSRLQQAGHRVTVVTKQDKDGELRSQTGKQGAELETYSPPVGRRLEQLNFLRSYVYQDIRTNPALWEKHLRRAVDKNSRLRRRVMNSIYISLGDIIRRSTRLQRAFKRVEAWNYADAGATDLLCRLQPDAVISTRPVDPMESFLLNAARRLKIERIMYLLSWDNITSKGFFPEKADKYLTWGAVMNSELKEFYAVENEQLYLTGVTHFDVHYDVMHSRQCAEPLEQLGLDGKKPYLFFTMSASYYAPNEIDIIEHLAKGIEGNAFGRDMQLLVRPHMANLLGDRSNQDWLERLNRLDSDRVKVNYPEAGSTMLTWFMAQDDMLRLSKLLSGADVCLNSGSTISIEALYLNRPVVITAFDTEPQSPWTTAERLNDYIHLKKLYEMNACKVAKSIDEMECAIQDYLADPDLDSANRQRAVQMECYRNDGQATDRFVSHINRILEGQ